jgi:small-conductance mechanosensitive channel
MQTGGEMNFFGVHLLGVNAENGRKLLMTLGLLACVWLTGIVLRAVARLVLRGRNDTHAHFWSRQGVSLATTALGVLVVVSVWFDQPGRLGTAAGLFTAGLAVALQRVVTAVAGYFVILRGRSFNVGDRIVLGGVRGDVVALGFIHTTIMEMGQPPPVQSDDPAMWVEARQYTGRIVTVTNDKVFDQPVYNYTRAFPFIWEEIKLPIRYDADRAAAERILLEAARRHTMPIRELGEPALDRLKRRFSLHPADLEPRVYLRLTDNWLELSVRFIAHEHGIRMLKDAMSRDILDAMQREGLEVASATFDVVGLPPLRISRDRAPGPEMHGTEDASRTV